MKAKYFNEQDDWGIFCGDDKIAWVDSRTVAEALGKEHTDVLDAIEKLECSHEFTELNFQPSTYKDKSGKKNPCYTMTREGFTALVNSYIKEEYKQIRKEFFQRFDEMEASINEKLAEKDA